MSRLRPERYTRRERYMLRIGCANAAVAFANDLTAGVLRRDTRSLRSIALDAQAVAEDLLAVARRKSRIRGAR